MRVLFVHNHYRQHGGEDESFPAEVDLLRGTGHEVVTYTQHNDRVETLGRLRSAARTVWSSESYGHLRELMRDTNPHVVDVQNFFPLISPSLYHAAHAERVPVVQTLGNYRMMCPNALFFRDGRVCEDCRDKRVPWPGVLHACYRQSRLATAPVAAMLTVHRLVGTWRHKVTLYAARTEFSRQKFIQGGLPAEKIVIKPNFVGPDPGVGEHRGGFALFVGRLSPEKGIRTLLEAWKSSCSGLGLKIIGDGPLRPMVESAARETAGIDCLGTARSRKCIRSWEMRGCSYSRRRCMRRSVAWR